MLQLQVVRVGVASISSCTRAARPAVLAWILVCLMRGAGGWWTLLVDDANGDVAVALPEIRSAPVSVNCVGYRFLFILISIGHRSDNRYPTGTAYLINKDT